MRKWSRPSDAVAGRRGGYWRRWGSRGGATTVGSRRKLGRRIGPEPSPPVSPYEALSEEKQAVLAYARKHPELRHREMAWWMVDEDVAYLSPSTVYRILKEANLVCPWRRRAKRKKTL
jgi:hypothetical protein